MANKLNTSIRNEIESIIPLRNTITIPTVDSVAADQQARYRADGLSYISNNESIIPRDGAGNIVMAESSSMNPLLIIDTVTEQITTKSALRILDTGFQYYKFPATIRPISNIEDLDVSISIDSDIDFIFARYKPSEDVQLSLATSYDVLPMNEVVEGSLQKVSNSYFITKEIKNSGKDLLFRIKLQRRYDTPTEGGVGTSFFSIIKSGPNFDTNTRWDEFAGGVINQYEVKNEVYERIILNSEFQIGDTFSLGATAGQASNDTFHTVNADQSYWVITDASKNVDLWNQEI
jgi:hypothetical protein